MKHKRNTAVYIRPATGLIIRDPYDDFKIIGKQGKKVSWNSFWIKRERAGEIEILKEAPTTQAPKIEEPKVEKKKK